ncbi:MAG: phosphoenolpyruvate carboxykinase (GTP) [Planctomycetes bacterium]|nr:phosphoenolpyruvate carboxykinase (GTP) [Planctomycetota bacterium]
MSTNDKLSRWVEEVERTVCPDEVRWCDGSDEENDRLIQLMLAEGTLHILNPRTYPDCYLHRSHPTDVARTEHLTFICASQKEDAGPTNNWMSPAEARERVGKLFQGCMKGRVMYVVPYLMGPTGSPYSRVGVEITDSPYVVANMRIMTRMGRPALDHLGTGANFVRGLHSLGDLSPERRFIAHFPETREIWSVGSGYGGNALLGKKCHALRIGSWTGRQEGWLAEHMLILGLESPAGDVMYIAAAFPSACGKTNLAMLVPPRSQERWKIWTVGDDIAWMHPGDDGRLYAINPEAGFFGVAPGTSAKTNPNAMSMLKRNVIFTNVAVTERNEPWWEGADGELPRRAMDWQGKRWLSDGKEKAAHPNSRFTVPARQCPSISREWENPRGVPISAIIFGGRRARLTPLVFEAFTWSHGVFVGATMASETTAAATGAVGVVRRDPMAMVPFCGYNMADYWAHWLAMARRLRHPPKLFHVNWFRRDPSGKFLWPGYGENLRVLRWIRDRVQGRGEAVETPIGFVPAAGSLELDGLDVTPAALGPLLSVEQEPWKDEVRNVKEYFAKFGSRLPAALAAEVEELSQRLRKA